MSKRRGLSVRPRTPPSRRQAILLAVAQLALVLGGTGAAVAKGGADDQCAGGSDSSARLILECVEAAIAFVDTPSSSGTGVLLPDGYIVTNAHVVDPHSEVTVVIAGETHSKVPLVGADLLADIALLGPVETETEPVSLEPGGETIVGDDVFLVGYPGERERDSVPAISRGVLSRIRGLDRWDLSYLQTDASIGPGQSGGALVDRNGRIIGISALRFADDFALALTADHVQRSIASIRRGDQEGYTAWPTDETGTDRFRIDYDLDTGAAHLAIPAAPEERTVELRFIGASVFVFASDHSGAPLGVNPAYVTFREQLAKDQGIPVDELLLPGVNLEPGIIDENRSTGVISIRVPADTLVYLELLAEPYGLIGGLHTTVVSNVPLGQPPRPEVAPIEVGATIDGVLDTFELADRHTVTLTAGDEIDVYAGAPTADMLVAIRGPGESWADATIVDDSDQGLYGTDAEVTYTATESGVHEIEVGAFSPYATGYQLQLSRAS